jgi:hypothetical protein
MLVAPLGIVVCYMGVVLATHPADTYRNDYAIGPGGWKSAPTADVDDKPCNIPRIRMADGELAEEAIKRTFRTRCDQAVVPAIVCSIR